MQSCGGGWFHVNRKIKYAIGAMLIIGLVTYSTGIASQLVYHELRTLFITAKGKIC